MRALERNKSICYYANYIGTQTIRDSDNQIIGISAQYTNPQKIKANISAAKGTAGTEMFGIDEGYSKIINPFPGSIGVSESSVFWIDITPEIKEDGSTNTPWDYTVSQIAKSINHTAIAVKKVDVSIGGAGNV